MIGHRRREFEHALNQLRALQDSPSELGILLRLQRSLFRKIVHLEESIVHKKESLREATSNLKNGRLTKSRTATLRQRIDRIRTCIEAYGFIIYLWKCMGDGIAFIYIDKYSLKQCYYEVDSASTKQTAGFLSGKVGAEGEIALVESVIEAGCPCLLSDLTNSIRYGDVCLINGNDPYFVEVKSAERKNKRGKR